MRINAIQGTSSVSLVHNNKMQQHLKNSSNVDSVEITSKPVTFRSNAGLKLTVFAASTLLGLVTGGAVGTIIGIAAGMVGGDCIAAFIESNKKNSKRK